MTSRPMTRRGLVPVPCTMMRGGTSRGAFFSAGDLPSDAAARDRVLLAAMGSPHPLQVDGIGGGNPLTSKVAIVGPSSDANADVDYEFAQVAIESAVVDTQAACGNILAAVGPFAIEIGLVAAQSPVTTVRIRGVNTGTITVATLNTPDGVLRYDGDEVLPGIVEPAAPVRLSFAGAAGAMTGQLLPTGRATEEIQGVPVSLIDYAIPVVIIGAQSLGLRGDESPAEIDANQDLLAMIELLRIEAGARMGLGDVSKSVAPKMAIVSSPRSTGTLTSRYLMPWRCHTSHAVTGALCLTAAIKMGGTVAAEIAGENNADGITEIEHPAGIMRIEAEGEGNGLVTSVVRTARLLFKGDVYVPASVLANAPSMVPTDDGTGTKLADLWAAVVGS